jgi:hypothetical protein
MVYWITKVSGVVPTVPPADVRRLIVKLPVVEPAVTASVSFVKPEPVTALGANVVLTPFGRVPGVKITEPAKLVAVSVTVMVADAPRLMVMVETLKAVCTEPTVI